jgi:hypothetical protein
MRFTAIRNTAVVHAQPCRSNHVGHGLTTPAPKSAKQAAAPLGGRRTHVVRLSLRSVHPVQQIFATISTSILWLHSPLANRACHRDACRRPRHLASSAAVAVAVAAIFSPMLGRRPLPAPPTPRSCCHRNFLFPPGNPPTTDQFGGFVRD